MDIITEELGIPKNYLLTTTREDRVIASVNKLWLKNIMKHSKLTEFIGTSNEFALNDDIEDVEQNRMKIYIRVFRKREMKVIPLPRIRNTNKDLPLLFPLFLQYISQTNYKNLWKESFKKYNNCENVKESQIVLADYNEVLREMIIRTYGCSIINVCNSSCSIDNSSEYSAHSNVYPTICAIETLHSIFLFHAPFIKYNLGDCVTFSPSVLERCYTKPLFIVYQLLQTFKAFHSRSLTLGDINLNDIYLTEDLWLFIFPQFNSNIYLQDVPKIDIKASVVISDCRKVGHKFDGVLKCQNCGMKTYDKVQISSKDNLEKLCDLWVNGQISNFTYLTALNNLSGRKYGEPNCHHVFPWVTDFSSRCGKNWRDLKKSKFRLNKGDRQLDLTFENFQGHQTPHHVSDVLSSITYYVYMARRTPQTILRKHVRSAWVPGEYPVSIQRLQEWTPDECIPEFFTEATVFKSIHNDLDDLEVPGWSSSPEDFVERHREILESSHVSERLHHWIDLTFGYKLAGTAAIKAKNVCLNLVDGHTNLTNSGIVQLFSQPHPPKQSNLQYWSKAPPKHFIHKQTKKNSRDRSSPSSAATIDTSKSEDDDLILEDDIGLPQFSGKSPLVISRFLSKSRSSLNEEQKENKPSRSPNSQRSASLGPKTPTFTSHVPSKPKLLSSLIDLPKDFSPAQALINCENRHSFISKTFYKEERALLKSGFIPQQETFNIKHDCDLEYDDHSQNSFTNRIFNKNFEEHVAHSKTIENQTKTFRSRSKFENHISCNILEIVASKRVKEMQILGCLIVEIFMSKYLRGLGNNTMNLQFEERLKSCITIIKRAKNKVPSCIKYLTSLLLQPDNFDLDHFKYPTVSNYGLPPPSAHLLLEPLSMAPFPRSFQYLYSLISELKDFQNTSTELNILYHFECNGQKCLEYEPMEKTKILLAQNIAECKVKACAKKLEVLMEHLNTNTDSEIIYLLVMQTKELIEDISTSVLAAWYLFDSVSRLIGHQKSVDMFLESLLKLYETEPSESNIPFTNKIAKLYHHSFHLRLIVRFGLKCFLDNFITPLVEAVGGYRDYEKVDFVLHTHSEKVLRKTSNLKTISSEQNELSPDDSSSSEKYVSSPKKETVLAEPEIFDFESEDPQPLQSLIEHLELNITSDLPFNIAEEAIDATLTENSDLLHNLEDLNIPEEIDGNYRPALMSPTIPIPLSNHNKELTQISCDVGSKTGENEDAHFDNMDSPILIVEPIHFTKAPMRKNDAKISEMSSECLIWLSHRLGPVLTAKYLSRNLLKMLTLCYVGKENLMVLQPDMNDVPDDSLDIVSIASSRIVGDKNANKVFECLSSIAALYGEQIILLQYLPHIIELVSLCKRRMTVNLEGSLISCLSLLKHIIPYISDATLVQQLEDILKYIIHPIVRLLGSTRYTFPNGVLSRGVLARKYLDALYILSLRMGADMSRTHLAVPALQRFFLIFEKISDSGYQKVSCSNEDTFTNSLEESHYVELKRDGTTSEWAIGGTPVHISHVLLKDPESADSLSPILNNEDLIQTGNKHIVNEALEELRAVFTSELAHTAYLPFLKQIGPSALEISLKNHQTILSLSQEYEQESSYTNSTMSPNFKLKDYNQSMSTSVNSSIGSNIALIGNRIDVQDECSEFKPNVLSLISDRMENTSRHLRGNWLAYWEHEIGRSEKDNMFNFKQIKLQTFSGHTHGIKALCVLDNENSFISGGRDKTVKLWSLRSQGDGSNISNCQWTYTGHKKSILALTFIESLRLVASCDSVVRIWDPFVMRDIKSLESSRNAPVNVLKTMPAPSALLFAATTDGSVKIIDARILTYIYELKVNLNPTCLIRCLAVSPSGNWVATGQSTGCITVLDTRTGLVLSTWRAHESEVLQLIALDEHSLISSSLDQTISVWNVHDGRFKHHMNFYLTRGASEPVHCLNLYNKELISGTTANRIGVHTSVDVEASFSSTKLRSDAFKGLLTSMAILPLNRLLLLGADSGNINLLC